MHHNITSTEISMQKILHLFKYNSIMCTCNLCVKEKQLKDNHFEYIAQKCLRYGADIQKGVQENLVHVCRKIIL